MIRSSPVIPDLKQGFFIFDSVAFFRCAACDYTIEVENDRGQINEPTLCENQDCRSKNSMVMIHNRCVFSDKQICRLQETPGTSIVYVQMKRLMGRLLTLSHFTAMTIS